MAKKEINKKQAEDIKKFYELLNLTIGILINLTIGMLAGVGTFFSLILSKATIVGSFIGSYFIGAYVACWCFYNHLIVFKKTQDKKALNK